MTTTEPAIVVVEHDHDTSYHQASGEISPPVELDTATGSRFQADRIQVSYRRTRTPDLDPGWTWHATVSGLISGGGSTRWRDYSSTDQSHDDIPDFVYRYVAVKHPDPCEVCEGDGTWPDIINRREVTCRRCGGRGY